jgi:hypothetical protein
MTETEVDTVSEVEPEDGKTFAADYVQKLRNEAAKYRNEVKALRPQAEELTALKDSQKSEIEKATARAEAAEKALANATLERDRMSVVLAKGLDPELAPLLSGATKEDIEAQAELLASRMSIKPTKPTSQLKSGATAPDDAGLTGKERAAAAMRQLRGSDH